MYLDNKFLEGVAATANKVEPLKWPTHDDD